MSDIIDVEFEVVDGGKSKSLSSTKSSDRLKIILRTFRVAEHSIADIRKVAKKINDEELNRLVENSYNTLLDTLKYIKKNRSTLNNAKDGKSGNLTLV